MSKQLGVIESHNFVGNPLHIARFCGPARRGDRRMVQLSIGSEYIGLNKERVAQLIDILNKAWDTP